MTNVPAAAPDRVLPTLNTDGSRRWIRPRPSPGRFLRARRLVGWALIALFVALPWLTVGGRPALLLDLPRREFSLFGTVFLATDTLLFMLLFVSSVIALFFVTALAGRVWCGWGCPQTVYLELLFRPLERLLEGGARGSEALDRARGLQPRRWLKNLLFAALALALAHVFLAYFVPVRELIGWLGRSPVEHPTSFLIVMGTAALILFDFGWFREQTCLVACPYGRLQSVLLDRRSIVVGYDARRGEPRRRGTRERPADAGDCIDCRLCVQTCPTGIDIRDGLQMECIHCTQCIDACDAVMDKIGRPRGLIRYSSSDSLAGRPARVLRPRVVIYPALLALALGLLAWGIGARAAPDVTLMRGRGEPWSRTPDGGVINQVRIKITNRGRVPRAYRLSLLDAPGAQLVAPVNPLPAAPERPAETSVFVVAPVASFHDGERAVRIRLDDGARWSRAYPFRLAGPEEEEEDGHHGAGGHR